MARPLLASRGAFLLLLSHSWTERDLLRFFSRHCRTAGVRFLALREKAVDPLAAAVVAICGGLLAMVGFTPRPQIFGWLCFVGIFAILLRFREDRKTSLWPIPLLFCLWINCHGSWSLGLATFAIVLGAGLIKKDVGSLTCAAWQGAELRQLSLSLGLSVAALFVNPFGWRLVLYPFDLAFWQKLNIGMISEWASVDFNDARGIYVTVALAAVLALALVPRRSWRIDDALLVAFALFCGLKHIRLLVFTGIVLPPLIAPQIGRLSSYDPKHERYVLNGVIVSAVLGMLVFAFPSNRALQAQMDGFFPSNAINYIRAHHLQGKLFNEYEWGGYLEWQAPELKVFVDSRADIFEHNGVLRDYVGMVNVYGSRELLDHYRIETVLFSTDSPLAYFLSTSAQWECVYKDKQAIVYRRVQR